MPLTIFTTVIFRVTTVFILTATATATAWAQQDYDIGGRYEFSRDVEALPSNQRGFDYSTSPRLDERAVSDNQPYGWLRGNHEYAEGGRDSIPNTGGSELGFETQYSYGERLELPLHYDWSSLEAEPAPARDAGHTISPPSGYASCSCAPLVAGPWRRRRASS